MRINEFVAVSTSKILLVPYSERHVPTYHDWMKDPEIQIATASELLSIKEEYDMQRSWRTDADKLTFILSLPSSEPGALHGAGDAESMIGDVNMFVSLHEEDDNALSLVAELELMIAVKDVRRKGYGRAALLTFLQYVLRHEVEILRQYSDHESQQSMRGRFDYFTAKINGDNEKSIALFESLGFVKTSTTPNYFNEFELRHQNLSLDAVVNLAEQHEINQYREEDYTLRSL